MRNGTVEGNAGTVSIYVQVATDGDFAGIVARAAARASSGENTEIRLDDDLMPAKTYFWRARAVSSAGRRPGSWSAAATFRTVAVRLGTPRPLSPINDATTTTLRPVFRVRNGTVEGHSGVADIRLEVASDAGFMQVVGRTRKAAQAGGETDLQLSKELTRATRYYWRVRALLASPEVVSDWSAIQRFRTPATAAFTPGGSPNAPFTTGGGNPRNMLGVVRDVARRHPRAFRNSCQDRGGSWAARAVMVVRWAVLLRAGGQSVPNRATARIFLVSSFVGAALPAGGADVTRACALSRSGVGGRAATASVVIDRMLGVVALLTLGVTSLALGALEANLPSARLVAGLCLTVAAAVLAGMIRADRIARFVLPRLLQQAALGRWLLAAAGEVAGYRSRPRALIGVFGLSLVVQWLRVTEVFLLGAGLGIDAGFGYYLVFMPIGLIVLMLPVSIAGLGLPQGVIIWLLRPAGVSDPQSFALSTLVVVLGVLGTLPGFFLYVRTRGGRA